MSISGELYRTKPKTQYLGGLTIWRLDDFTNDLTSQAPHQSTTAFLSAQLGTTALQTPS